MKKYNKKNKGVVKGAPSAFVISILVHVGAFLLAGMLVVFTVAKKEEKQFVPPKPVERPKMKLKKPKVKIKKSSKPKPTTRIVTKMNKANMPDIQLPEMSGLGDGLGDFNSGGFELFNLSAGDTIVGNETSMGTDLEGTFYHMRRTRNGSPYPIMTQGKFTELMWDFLEDDWNVNKFSRYYRSPKKLYATSIFLPTINSYQGPEAFGEPDCEAYLYAILYKGKIVHPKGGRFRFHFVGDNFMFIRLDGRMFGDFGRYAEQLGGQPQTSQLTQYHMGHWPAYKTEWFDLEPGVPQDLEIIFGEYDGGLFSAAVAIEQEGVKYPTNIEGGPMLPIFKTARISRDQAEIIHQNLYEGNYYAITNGPIFNDFADDREDYDPDYREAYND